MYKQFKTPTGQLVENAILRIADNTYIPFVIGNTDYESYLEWLADGNTPLPADEPANG
jgi:hypothetical protein